LSFRAALGRSQMHDVPPSTYSNFECGRYARSFGRVPIVIFLGDFLQLPPTAMISLIEDVNAKNPDGSYKYEEPPSVEVQHACKLFEKIPYVFELRGTKRFVAGDPLAEFLTCMRADIEPGCARFPPAVWEAFERTFAKDAEGILDGRHNEDKFINGHGLAIYWETVSRWSSQRAQRDARALGVPLVFLQAADECNTLTENGIRLRMLEVVNLHKSGDAHGVFVSHEFMRVRFSQKLNAAAGLVQEQKGTIVKFVFHPDDEARYSNLRPGDIFRPRYLPSGIWLQLDDFIGSPVFRELLDLDLVGIARTCNICV